MGTTANYSIPYAETSDPPHGPNQQQSLAEATDTALNGVDSRVSDLENERVAGARYEQSADQTPSPYTITKLNLDTVSWSRGSAVSAASSTDKTLSRSGVWLISATANISGIPQDGSRPANSTVSLTLADASSFSTVFDRWQAPCEAEGYEVTFTRTIEITSSITVSLYVNAQTSASSYTVGAAALDAVWLGE